MPKIIVAEKTKILNLPKQVHGVTLYLVVLLLSRLSDFRHRGWGFFIGFGVVLVPLVYSVGKKTFETATMRP